MKYWRVDDPSGTTIYDEFDIIIEYGPHWRNKMLHLKKENNLISLENCLQDFIVINWAVEIAKEEALHLREELKND